MSSLGRTALVTGAARQRGIGRGIALRLAEDGWNIAVNDVAAFDEGEQVVREIAKLGRRARFYRADVTSRSEVDGMIAAVLRDFGDLQAVCSNAGVADWHNLVEVAEDSFDRIVAVNLTGAFNVCQAGARALVARGQGGRIVITSSVHVQMPFPQMSVYGATKQGLRALAEHMAVELAPHGITVNHVGPGWVRSAINDPSPALQTEADVQATLRLIPLGRPAEPEEIGSAVAYLCSDQAAYITGEFLRIDGGFVVGKF